MCSCRVIVGMLRVFAGRFAIIVSRTERKHATGAEQNCTTWVVPDGPGLARGWGLSP